MQSMMREQTTLQSCYPIRIIVGPCDGANHVASASRSLKRTSRLSGTQRNAYSLDTGCTLKRRTLSCSLATLIDLSGVDVRPTGEAEEFEVQAIETRKRELDTEHSDMPLTNKA